MAFAQYLFLRLTRQGQCNTERQIIDESTRAHNAICEQLDLILIARHGTNKRYNHYNYMQESFALPSRLYNYILHYCINLDYSNAINPRA